MPGFRAKIKGSRRSLATEPAKINPLLSILTTKSAENSLVILVNSSQVFLNGSGVSIKLVMSLNLIPGIGKSSTFLICFFKSNLSLVFNYLHQNGKPQATYVTFICEHLILKSLCGTE